MEEIIKTKLPEIQRIITEKLKELTTNRTAFNTRLMERLKNILKLIIDFKGSKYKELIDAKKEYDIVFNELDKTRKELDENRIKLSNIENKLQFVLAREANMSKEIDELTINFDDCNNKKLKLTEENEKKKTEIENLNINNAEKQTALDDLNQKYTTDIDELEKQKKELQSDIATKQIENDDLKKKIDEFNEQQNQLNEKLETLSVLLDQHITTLSNITTDMNIPDLEETLNQITQSLTEVIIDINTAGTGSLASGSSGSTPVISTPVKSTPVKYEYQQVDDNFAKIVAYKKYLKSIGTKESDIPRIFKGLTYKDIDDDNTTIEDFDAGAFSNVDVPANRNIIKEILRNKKLKIPDAPKIGGKRKCKRKTMKRRSRKSRKLMKGGYTYNKNDKLNNASSDVSNLSISSSGTNINTKRKSKKGYKRPRSRTKRRSRK